MILSCLGNYNNKSVYKVDSWDEYWRIDKVKRDLNIWVVGTDVVEKGVIKYLYRPDLNTFEPVVWKSVPEATFKNKKKNEDVSLAVKILEGSSKTLEELLK